MIEPDDSIPRLVARLAQGLAGRDRQLEWLDEICTTFERQWTPTSQIATIQQIMEHVPEDRQAAVNLELVQLDIELGWMHIEKTLKSAAAAHSGTTLSLDSDTITHSTQQGPEPLSWRDYQGVFDLSDSAIGELQLCEWIARLRYGDCPEADLFPALSLDDIDQRLLPHLSVLRESDPLFEGTFLGSLDVGRQALDEPDPVQLWRTGKRQKLILTEALDNSISRQQLTMQLRTNSLIDVFNSSSNRAVGIISKTGDDGDYVIGPQQGTRIKLPIVIKLDPIELEISRHPEFGEL